IIYGFSGIAGNAATRIEPYATSGGIYAYGGYPDIDGLFKEQVVELAHKKREAVLHRVQQLIHEKVMFLPIWQLVVLNGQGSRVAESGLGLIDRKSVVWGKSVGRGVGGGMPERGGAAILGGREC